MGQKVNPNGFRIGVIRDWNTRWYAQKKDFADFLVEDHKIRKFVKESTMRPAFPASSSTVRPARSP